MSDEGPDGWSLKRLAWAYGCATKGSDEEATAKQRLIEGMREELRQVVCDWCGQPQGDKHANQQGANVACCDCFAGALAGKPKQTQGGGLPL